MLSSGAAQDPRSDSAGIEANAHSPSWAPGRGETGSHGSHDVAFGDAAVAVRTADVPHCQRDTEVALALVLAAGMCARASHSSETPCARTTALVIRPARSWRIAKGAPPGGPARLILLPAPAIQVRRLDSSDHLKPGAALAGALCLVAYRCPWYISVHRIYTSDSRQGLLIC
jgi:hypothetical protein